MRVRINSTNRRRIGSEHVRIALRQPAGGGRTRVEPQFELEELRLPADARIVVEAYRGSFTERFLFGTVAEAEPEGVPELGELDREGLLFRVKVVEPGTGRLLALARQLRPDGAADSARHELFRLRPADLKEELWRVELAEDDGPPWLLLNNRFPDPVARFREPLLRAAILPAAMRTVLLTYLLQGAEAEQDHDPGSWTQRWLHFAGGLAGDDPPSSGSSDEEVLAWVDKACAEFAASHAFVGTALGATAAEGGA